MGINKVQYGNTTLIDLTADTVTADKLMEGYTAHDRSGALITGTATGGGGGSVTQDQDGYIVLPSTGGGGGGSSYTLLGTEEVTVSTTTTSTTDIDDSTITISRQSNTDKILLIQVRDKAGKRNGYFYGTDMYWMQPSGGSVSNNYRLSVVYITNSSGNVVISSTSQYGVFSKSPPTFSTGSVTLSMCARYNASYSTTIDGTYVVNVYDLDYPNGNSPFAT